MAGRLEIALGPEQREELISAHALRSGRGQAGKEGEPATRLGALLLLIRQRETAKGLQTKHCRTPLAALTQN